ncbi:MAG: transporter [Acidobacteriota bacterium]
MRNIIAHRSAGLACGIRPGLLGLAATLLLQVTVMAGPPFQTDDPAPLPLHTGEFYLFATGTRTAGETDLDAGPGVELNYSAFRNTFFHLVVPLASSHPFGEPSAYGLGDIETGFKWRFLQQSRSLLDVGIFPFLELPTGDEMRGLGNGKPQVLLPLWLGKDSEAWTVYGGAGYWINPGAGNRNWWFTGLVVQRQITQRLYLGGELYHQTPDTKGGSPGTGFDVGGGLTLAGPYQVLFSAGRNIQDPVDNRFSFYAALYRTF